MFRQRIFGRRCHIVNVTSISSSAVEGSTKPNASSFTTGNSASSSSSSSSSSSPLSSRDSIYDLTESKTVTFPATKGFNISAQLRMHPKTRLPTLRFICSLADSSKSTLLSRNRTYIPAAYGSPTSVLWADSRKRYPRPMVYQRALMQAEATRLRAVRSAAQQRHIDAFAKELVARNKKRTDSSGQPLPFQLSPMASTFLRLPTASAARKNSSLLDSRDALQILREEGVREKQLSASLPIGHIRTYLGGSFLQLCLSVSKPRGLTLESTRAVIEAAIEEQKALVRKERAARCQEEEESEKEGGAASSSTTRREQASRRRRVNEKSSRICRPSSPPLVDRLANDAAIIKPAAIAVPAATIAAAGEDDDDDNEDLGKLLAASLRARRQQQQQLSAQTAAKSEEVVGKDGPMSHIVVTERNNVEAESDEDADETLLVPPEQKMAVEKALALRERWQQQQRTGGEGDRIAKTLRNAETHQKKQWQQKTARQLDAWGYNVRYSKSRQALFVDCSGPLFHIFAHAKTPETTKAHAAPLTKYGRYHVVSSFGARPIVAISRSAAASLRTKTTVRSGERRDNKADVNKAEREVEILTPARDNGLRNTSMRSNAVTALCPSMYLSLTIGRQQAINVEAFALFFGLPKDHPLITGLFAAPSSLETQKGEEGAIAPQAGVKSFRNCIASGVDKLTTTA